MFAISQASSQNDTSQSLQAPEPVQFTIAFKGHNASVITGSLACGEADVK